MNNTSYIVIKHIIVNEKNIGYDDENHLNGEIMSDKEWMDHAKGLLKSELKLRNIGYRELAERLTAMGIAENERNLANKISRGSFTAAFFLQCMRAIGCDAVTLNHLPKSVESN